jgi:O-antigen/teichoic acid export membrane protein
VHLAILMKEMNFGQITKINFLSSVIGIFVGLYLGYYNFGVWSIIWMYLTTETIKSLLLWQYSWWRPKLTFSKVKLKIHYNFGYKLMLSGIIDIIFKNIYNILIGRFYSIQILGYYERAIQFSEYPSSSLTGVLTKVSYPLLSKIHNDKPRIESAYRKLLRISFFIIAPIMMGTAAIAKPLFLFFFWVVNGCLQSYFSRFLV